jgi:hypothetical protein
MDYNRIYWLCLLGFGLLIFVNLGPDFLAGGVDGASVVGTAGSAIVIATALYGVARPTAVDGPTRPNVFFWAVVLGFVLMFAGTVLPFV